MNPVGDQWNRIDLHVHTPYSNETEYGNSESEETWNAFFTALEELGEKISVLGINDYWSIDGYKRVLSAKREGRLENVKLLLPIIEMRLFEYSTKKSIQNFHVLFSSDISAEIIEEKFLRRLTCSPDFGPEAGGFAYGLNDDDLFRLGRLLEEQKGTKLGQKEADRRRKGLISAARSAFFVSHQDVTKILDATPEFSNRTLQFAGYSEMSDFRDSGPTASYRKSIIASVDALFVASPNKPSFDKALENMRRYEPDACLIHSSDSHRFDDGSEKSRYLGLSQMWARCAFSFESLKFAIAHPSTRLSYGQPKEVERKSRPEFNAVESVAVTLRGEGSKTADDPEFSYDFPMNPGYSVIVGNKGQGKSALADWISYTASEFDDAKFSFLNSNRFRPASGRESSFYEAKSKWRGKEGLSKAWKKSAEHPVSRIDYYPQNYLESLCNSDPLSEKREWLDSLVQELLFMKTPTAKRQDAHSFDELLKIYQDSSGLARLSATEFDVSRVFLSVKTAVKLEDLELSQRRFEVNKRIEALRAEVRSDGTSTVDSDRLANLVGFLEQKSRRWGSAGELADLPGPGRSSFTLEFGDLLRDNWIDPQTGRAGELPSLQDRVFAEEIIKRVGVRFEKAVEEVWRSSSSELNMLEGLFRSARIEKQGIASVLDKELKVARGEKQRATGDSQKLQQLAQLSTGKCDPRSDTWSLRGIDELERELQECEKILKDLRKEFTLTFTKAVKGLSDSVRGLNAIFNEIIFNSKLRDVGIGVGVRVLDALNDDQARNAVNAGASRELQHALDLRRSLYSEGFSGGTSVEKLAGEYYDSVVCLTRLLVAEPKNVSKRAKMSAEMICGELLDSSRSRLSFELELNGTPLQALSPGQRGLVLMLFVLYLDGSQNVLVLDQPEDNLDNETIKSLLLPAIEDARKRRQLIIVTHNANIGVLGDPDQVLICKKEGNSFRVQGGSLSESTIQEQLLGLLEGAEDAFRDRGKRYGFTLKKKKDHAIFNSSM